MVLEHYGCNTSCTTIFSEIYCEKTLRCPYKNYNSLNMWQANWDLLYVFTCAIYLSVTMHLRQGKKVSIIPPGDVNP
jgi:hypothetical protein